MREAARHLLAALPDPLRDRATAPFGDPARTDWTYLPRQRRGAPVHAMDRDAAAAAFALLSAGLSLPAFAQACTISAWEDVLDRVERGRRGRHRGDAWVLVFGDPDGDGAWSWRFEAHHLSVNHTIDSGGQVRGTPLFLGANPARVTDGGRTVLEPLGVEEQLGFALIGELGEAAIVADDAPRDIVTRDDPAVGDVPPAGVAIGDMTTVAAGLARELVDRYLARLPAPVADAHRARTDLDAVRFAWAGGRAAGQPHYHRLHGPRLLVELDNTQDDANHVHTVLRDPEGDFGGDLLAVHQAHSE